MPRSRSVVRRLAALLMIGCQTACSVWKTSAVSPQEVVARETPKSVRVTRSDGRQVVLVRPLVAGDSLRGERPDQSDANHPQQQSAVPLSDIRKMDVRRVDAGRTALLIAGLGLTAAAATMVIVLASIDEP
jgi:hypothetical protein